MASASGYNHHRYARSLLKKSKRWEPSLTIQLHQHNWRFEHSAMLFTYDGPMKPFLLALRAQVIPPSLIPFLYDIKPPVSFVDGCLVVEIQDLRRNPEVRSRVVMRPAAEALPQTIDVMLDRRGQGGDERLALELESRIISATSPPLYLGTSILAARNAVLALSLTAPAQATLSADGSTRSVNDTSLSSSSSDIERMRRLIRAGDRSAGGAGSSGASFQPNWSVLRAKDRAMEIEREKQREKAEQQAAAQAAYVAQQQQMQQQQQQQMQQAGEGGQAASGGEKKKTKKKRPAPTANTADDDAPAAAESTTKKPKKKKTAAATAAASAAAASAEGGDKKAGTAGVAKIEPATSANANAGAAGVTPDKPKKTTKKKKPAAAAATAAPAAPAAAPAVAASGAPSAGAL